MYLNNIIFDNDFCNEIFDKKIAFLAHKESINTIVIGSSHTNYGINPAYFNLTTFNFGLTSLDMMGAYYLLNIYAKDLPNLENVIIEMSIFSPGFDLIKTNEKWRCFYYKQILSIPYDIDANPKILHDWEMQTQTRKIKNNYFGYERQTWFGNWSAKERYASHLKHCLRKPEPLKYLKLINKWCADNGKRLIIFVPPCRPDYENHISLHVKKLLNCYIYQLMHQMQSIIRFYQINLFVTLILVTQIT